MDINTAVQVLPYLEGSKLNAANDIMVTSAALEMTFEDNKDIWKSSSRERELLNNFLSGDINFSKEDFGGKSDEQTKNTIKFLQGIIVLGLSIVDGIGRAPLELISYDKKQLNVRASNNNIRVDVGSFNQGTESLIAEFKNQYYGTIANTVFSKDDLTVILEAFTETVERFDTEIKFMENVARDPLSMWSEGKNFSSLFFVIVSSLPVDTLNSLFMEIASYLPEGIQVRTENGNTLDLKNYFGMQTVENKEIFRKIRLLLRNYFGDQREILGMIIQENIKGFFAEVLKHDNVKREISRHIKETITDQFKTRKVIFESFIKLLK